MLAKLLNVSSLRWNSTLKCTLHHSFTSRMGHTLCNNVATYKNVFRKYETFVHFWYFTQVHINNIVHTEEMW